MHIPNTGIYLCWKVDLCPPLTTPRRSIEEHLKHTVNIFTGPLMVDFYQWLDIFPLITTQS